LNARQCAPRVGAAGRQGLSQLDSRGWIICLSLIERLADRRYGCVGRAEIRGASIPAVLGN
jgi:hypothetical protein